MESEYAFMNMAKEASKYSRCRKIQRGCVLVLEDGYAITGTNGPPNPLDMCADPCPRQNAPTRTMLDVCRAVHAERQCILKAAAMGLCTSGSTLYSYMGVPCSECMLECIQAGVKEIVCLNDNLYDELSGEILKEWITKGGKFRIYKKSDNGYCHARRD